MPFSSADAFKGFASDATSLVSSLARSSRKTAFLHMGQHKGAMETLARPTSSRLKGLALSSRSITQKNCFLLPLSELLDGTGQRARWERGKIYYSVR